MNILRFTEDIAAGAKIIYSHSEFLPGLLRDLSFTPVITYDFGRETTEQLTNRIRSSFQDVERVPDTPFSEFRYWMRFPSMTYYGLCVRFSDVEMTTFGIAQANESERKLILKTKHSASRKPGMVSWEGRSYTWPEGKQIDNHTLSLLGKKSYDQIVGMSIFGIEAMCGEYLRPDQHIARVCPDSQGKSVQWKKARSHYTIVHRYHAANKAGLVNGSKIRHNADHIERIAHTRRAHYRILKSEKFKNMRGKKLFIKSMWVGPSEWNDGSGQIYRIAELPARSKL